MLIQGELSISNVTFKGITGTDGQIGSFTGGNSTNLGINQGIVMASGFVKNVPGAVGTTITDYSDAEGDADLQALIGGNTSYQAAVLEFDFMPTANTVKFRYVFASEEYNEWVCSSFNDVFGFFLSGPGINGTFSNNAENIALIPGSTNYVAINTINNGTGGSSGTNCIFTNTNLFVDNIAANGQTIAFDGFTKVLTATYTVEPCKIYHIKLAVSDISDGLLDSGVFLEANSFEAGNVVITPSYLNPTIGGNFAIEGCTQGKFTFSIASAQPSPYVINYSIGGTATNGTDYNNISGTITIPTGQTSADLIITPTLDALNESIETIILNVSPFCETYSDTLFIKNNSPIIANANGDTTICIGEQINITASGTGGRPPYVFTWDNGAGSGNSVPVSPPLGTTTYTVTVADACTYSTDNVSIKVNPCEAEVETTGGTICAGGSFSIEAIKILGTEHLTYKWSNGLPDGPGPHNVSPMDTTVYTVTMSDNFGNFDTDTAIVNVNPLPVTTITPNNSTICVGTSTTLTASGATSYVWSNNATTSAITVQPNTPGANTYTVTGTSNGCSSFTEAIVNVAVNPILAVTQVTHTTCGFNNGAVSVAVQQNTGTAPFKYSWNTNPNIDTNNVANLASGNYEVNVTDKYGCTSIIDTTVAPSTPINITGIIEEEKCSGDLNGSIDVTVEDATGDLTYLWSNDSTTQDLNAIAGGSYTLIVTDGNKCEATKVFNVGTHPKLYASATSEPEYCGQKNGKAIATATGGTMPYEYKWDTDPIQTTQVAEGLEARIYNVTVTDGHCTVETSVPVNAVEGPSLTVDTVIHATCSLNNGGVVVSAKQGSPNYTFKWSNNQTGDTLANLNKGTYTVTVTDSKGCIDTTSIVIQGTTVPAGLITNITTTNCGYSNGAITVTSSGGVQPYSYLWNTIPAQTSASAIGIIAGNYTVTISDINGCTTTVSGTVPEYPGPKVTASSTPEICGQNNGTVTAMPTDGHGAPYTYLWSNGDTTAISDSLNTGTYTVTISDGGCTVATSIHVSEIPGPQASFLITPKYATLLDNQISFLDNTSGNITNWSWTLGDGTIENKKEFNHSYFNTGIYPITMIVVDDKGCVDTIQDSIIIRDIYTIYIPNAFSPNDDEFNDLFTPQGTFIDPEGFEMYIFDRWGSQMYYTTKWGDNQAAEPWNGTYNNTGSKEYIIFDTYVYKIIIKELKGPRHQYFGKITLIQ